MIILNYTDKCSGSATHVIRTTGASSILDYMLAPVELLNSIEKLVIDESTQYCPFRVIHKKKGNICKFSDHNSMILTIEVPRTTRKNVITELNFNLSPKNLLLFNEKMEEASCGVETHGCNAQNTYNKFEYLTMEVMHKTLASKQTVKKSGFVIHKKFSFIAKKISSLAKKGKIQRKIAREYREKLLQFQTDMVAERNAENLLKSVQNLTENDRFSVQKFWRARKMLRKTPDSITSVHRDGEVEVFNDHEIIEQYREEFDDRLSSVNIPQYLTEYKELTDELYRKIIETANKYPEPNFTMEELDSVIGSMNNGAPGPDRIPPKVFKSGGSNFRVFLLHVLNCIKNEKKVPVQWQNTNVIPIYKGKGPKKNLLNQRGIFLTQVVSKI